MIRQSLQGLFFCAEMNQVLDRLELTLDRVSKDGLDEGASALVLAKQFHSRYTGLLQPLLYGNSCQAAVKEGLGVIVALEAALGGAALPPLPEEVLPPTSPWEGLVANFRTIAVAGAVIAATVYVVRPLLAMRRRRFIR